MGTGSYMPERILTNEDLSRTVDTTRRVDHHADRHQDAPDRGQG